MDFSQSPTNLETNIINKINEEFGSDLTKLSSCDDMKQKLEFEKNKIENSLLLNGSEVPSKISTAIQHVHDTLEKIKKLSDDHTNLNKSVDIYEERVNKIKSMAANYIDKINALEKATDYLEVIKKLEELSNLLESGINEKNEKKQISNYLMLYEIKKSLYNTKCSHLYLYANETVHYWYNILKDKFTTDYEEILKVIKWPFVGSALTSVQAPETLNSFQTLTQYLIEIQIDREEEISPSTLTIEFEPLSLPMMQLIKPLKKRFVYHFMGTRQTNRADKPEWYFTQILTWIKDHHEFVEKNVQPVYSKLNRKKVTAKTEFMRGLVQIAVEKLHYELPHLYYDDSLFSHCVDEALGFDREVRNSYGYPAVQPGVIEVLTQAQTFLKWINMEKHFTQEKMDVFLTSPTAFNTIVSGDIDENRVTECADSFINLLSTLTERYEIFRQPGHKLQFLQLQLDLIDDFRVRLLQKLGEEKSEPLNSKFPNILNTVNYVTNVLAEWGVTTHFLHLQYYKSKLQGDGDSAGTVFDDYLKVLGKMRDDLLLELTDHVFMDMKAKSMPYRKDKWHAMESIKNFVKPTITATACPVFQVLISKLHQLQVLLATSLFENCWHMLAKKIDHYLYEEIAAICVFNEGGAMQFHYDITKNLFPLFGQYSTKPDSNFKLLKDACVILSMSKGMAISLLQTLNGKDEQYDSTEVLVDVGVFTLQKYEVLSLLSRRTDLD
ncbi:hypothetical protein RUM44_010857 [Polyplax serrata]|uniref:RAD50-interacting protein 1 n=1 Tax=Polyplax serrata TaxID=468196 RepID=A0ABR1ANN6_POLSC